MCGHIWVNIHTDSLLATEENTLLRERERDSEREREREKEKGLVWVTGLCFIKTCSASNFCQWHFLNNCVQFLVWVKW